MATSKILQTEARSLRAAIGRNNKTSVVAHRQLALRRIGEVLLLAECNLPHAQAMMAEARYHAQFVLQAS
jgi:hypothetical protein